MNDTKTWPDLAIGLYEKLTEHNAELTYEFDHLDIGVPSSSEANAAVANWHINGTVKIRARDAE